MKGHQPAFGKGAFLVGGVTPGDDFRTVKTDRRVPIRSVPCPDCAADVGEFCVKPDGTQTYRHVARRRMALRAERETS